MTDINIDSVGVVIRVTVRDEDTKAVVNLSTCTTKQIVLLSPTGSEMPKTASFVTDGSDGKLEYVLQSGDITEPGEWKVRCYVEAPTFSGTTSEQKFLVVGTL